MSITAQLFDADLIEPPTFVVPDLAYETRAGSVAYGVATESSDIDVVGFCVPPREMVFPHLAGEILDFGRQKKRFSQFQAHGQHLEGREYDLTVYSIVRFFDLAMDNNPNMLELLFTPDSCVTHSTPISMMVRRQRRIFLHKGAFHRLRGFAYSQMSKLEKKERSPERLRKYAYHAVRLLDEAEQILSQRDLELGRNTDSLLAIREGEWTLEDVQSYFESKEAQLQELYDNSDVLPYSPDEDAIKSLLLDCLEEHYGSLNGCVVRDTDA